MRRARAASRARDRRLPAARTVRPRCPPRTGPRVFHRAPPAGATRAGARATAEATRPRARAAARKRRHSGAAAYRRCGRRFRIPVDTRRRCRRVRRRGTPHERPAAGILDAEQRGAPASLPRAERLASIGRREQRPQAGKTVRVHEARAPPIRRARLRPGCATAPWPRRARRRNTRRGSCRCSITCGRAEADDRRLRGSRHRAIPQRKAASGHERDGCRSDRADALARSTLRAR